MTKNDDDETNSPRCILPMVSLWFAKQNLDV